MIKTIIIETIMIKTIIIETTNIIMDVKQTEEAGSSTGDIRFYKAVDVYSGLGWDRMWIGCGYFRI